MVSHTDATGLALTPGGLPTLSAFDVTLDAITTSVPDAAPAPSLVEVSRVDALRVLLVDDVAMNREIVASFLRAAGHITTCVKSGSEAVAAVATADFDVVLMDVRMPEMDGLEATRRIRALDGARGRVPIIALTGQTSPEQIAQCARADMNGHFAKSFDLDALLATVVQAAAVIQWCHVIA